MERYNQYLELKEEICDKNVLETIYSIYGRSLKAIFQNENIFTAV